MTERIVSHRGEHGPFDEGEDVQYAYDVDEWDGTYRQPGGDSNMNPIRVLTFPHNVYAQPNDASFLEHVKSLARIHNHNEDGSIVIRRRTVTYGPWETVAEVKPSVGWY